MAKGTKIAATFSDGTVLTRTTTMQRLTSGYGWIVRGLRTKVQANACWGGKREVGDSGFSGTAELARRQIAGVKSYMETVTFEEVVPVEVVT